MDPYPESPDLTVLNEGTPVRQFSVMLQNRAGALSSLVQLLEIHHVVTLGFSVRDSSDATIVRLIVSDPESAEELFMEKGIPHTSCPMAVVELAEGCSRLLECLDCLFRAETNIHFAYPMMPSPQGKTLLALCLEDHDFGVQVMRSSGLKVLFQEDLSR